MRPPVYLVLLAVTLLYSVGIGIILPLLPLYAQAMGAGGTWVGLIAAADPMVRAALAIMFGRMAESRSMKRFLVCGLVGYAVAGGGFTMATAPWHLLGWRLLQGISSAMLYPISQAYAAILAPKGREGRVMSLFYMFQMGGFAMGPALSGLVANRFGFVAPFGLMAVLSSIALLSVLAFIPERRDWRAGGVLPSMALLMKDHVVQSVVLAYLVISIAWGTFTTLFPIWGSVHLGYSTFTVGILLTVWAIVEALCQPIFGVVSDMVSRRMMVLLAMVIMPISICLIPHTSLVWHLAAISVVMGLGGGIFLPAISAAAVDRGRAVGMSSMMGAMNAALGCGVAAGSLSAGLGMDLVGIGASFRLMVGLVALGMVAYTLRSRGLK